MENAQLIALSRQVALQRQMDVVANNMANINTTGFKAESVLFEDYLMPVAKDRDFAVPDQILNFTQDWATIHDMKGGDIVQTGNQLDVALGGEGFLAVQTPAGERYTRAGALQINAAGTLVNFDGYPVLSEQGPMQFASNDTDVSIGRNGAVTTNNGSKGKLRIVEFADPQQLAREGDNLYSGGTPIAAVNTVVTQGAIEKSNVSGVSEMTSMIRVQRAYQTLATLMQRQDDMRHSAIQRLGDVNA